MISSEFNGHVSEASCKFGAADGVTGSVRSISIASVTVTIDIIHDILVTVTSTSYNPSVRAGVIVLSASVHVPFPLLVAL